MFNLLVDVLEVVDNVLLEPARAKRMHGNEGSSDRFEYWVLGRLARQLMLKGMTWKSSMREKQCNGKRALHFVFFCRVNQSGSVTDKAIMIATTQAPNARKGFRRNRFARVSLRSNHADKRFIREVILVILMFSAGY